MSQTKHRAFKIVAILLPLGLLCLVEVLLRIFDYGYDSSLFIKDPDDQTCWIMNPAASAKFFSDPVNATKGNRDRFKVVKEKGTMRIFVLGESTTAGYPYMHNGAFPRWLQYRLLHSLPAQKFEIINLSLTAVSSYTVVDFGKQIVDYAPDAVLVYAGHNEYYGALGIGSTSHINGSRFWIKTVLKLRQLRLVQAINSGVIALQKGLGGMNTDTRENLMKRMAQTQRIPYGSAVYLQGVEQFDQNMNELCKIFSEKRIPVIVSTLVSNEKDLAPFISSNGVSSAMRHYKRGKMAYDQGNFRLAKAELNKAEELDQLRFRAPKRMNTIIAGLPLKYPGVFVADSRKAFEGYAAHHILGNETLLEHVHPNLMGYALMSEAFYQQMKRSHVLKIKPAEEWTFDRLLQNMPVTRVDSLNGVYQIMMLKAGWPFNTPIPSGFKRGESEDEKLAGALSVDHISWSDAMNQLFEYSLQAGHKQDALKATEAMLLEHPGNVTYYIYAGRLCFEVADFKRAETYFKKAYQLDASTQNAQNLYLLALKSDQPKKALHYLSLLKRANEADATVDEAQRLIEQIIRLKSVAYNALSKTTIATNYHLLGADEAASHYSTNVIPHATVIK